MWRKGASESRGGAQDLLPLLGTLGPEAGDGTHVFAGKIHKLGGASAGGGEQYFSAFPAKQQRRRRGEERQPEEGNQGEVSEVFKHNVHMSMSRLPGD